MGLKLETSLDNSDRGSVKVSGLLSCLADLFLWYNRKLVVTKVGVINVDCLKMVMLIFMLTVFFGV